MTVAGEIIQLKRASYTLCSPLATSSYGVVWRAWSEGRAVALKLVNLAKMQQAQADLQHNWIASAEQEIAFLQQLSPWDQRHIARLLDHGEYQSLPAFALELHEENLHRHLHKLKQQGQRPSPDACLTWLSQINQALAKVHQYGWCYLDLKPANLLLSGTQLKLVDFGSTASVGTQNFRGTPNWQAPEQFFPANTTGEDWQYSLDYRSDYFVLGAMLYFLVCGLPLRFCSLCGQAYRQHGVWGAQKLRPEEQVCTLYADEEQLFLQSMRGANTGESNQTDCGPAADSAAAQAALALLKQLLQYQAEQRPHSAMQISRALAQIRSLSAPKDEPDTAIATAQPSALAAPYTETEVAWHKLAWWRSHAKALFADLILACLTLLTCIGLLAIWTLPASAAIESLSGIDPVEQVETVDFTQFKKER